MYTTKLYQDDLLEGRNALTMDGGKWKVTDKTKRGGGFEAVL